jgi:hypothetical protein
MSSLRFYLVEPFLKGREVEISQDAYAALVEAHKILVAFWNIEESFSLAADAFVAFERELLLIALDYEYRSTPDTGRRAGMDGYRRRINLRLVTFLAAVGTYQDHVMRRVSSLDGRLGMSLDEVKALASRLYDQSFEYRVMTTLRNQAVHSHLPLGGLSLGGRRKWEGDRAAEDVPSRRRMTVDPVILCRDFCNSDKGNVKTKNEVAFLGCEKLDLKFFVRSYIEQIAKGHWEFRELTVAGYQSAVATIRDASQRHWPSDEAAPKLLTVEARPSKGRSDQHLIDDKHFEEVARLREGWQSLRHVRDAYISSVISRGPRTHPTVHGGLWIGS